MITQKKDCRILRFCKDHGSFCTDNPHMYRKESGRRNPAQNIPGSRTGLLQKSKRENMAFFLQKTSNLVYSECFPDFYEGFPAFLSDFHPGSGACTAPGKTQDTASERILPLRREKHRPAMRTILPHNRPVSFIFPLILPPAGGSPFREGFCARGITSAIPVAQIPD